MEKRKSGIVVIVFLIITVAAIVFVVLLRNMMNRNEGKALDVSKYADRGIAKAYEISGDDGEDTVYDVFVTVPGYKSDIATKVRIAGNGAQLIEVQVLSQDETPELGGRILEDSFLNQFKGKKLPLTMPQKKAQTETEENAANSDLGEAVQRKDGVYRAEGEEFGGNRSQVTMVIENGEIMELLWDSFDSEGNGKRALSLQGKYTMTEDGLLWADQADALQNYVIEHQGLNGLTTNEEGKTDVISGVSINIASFKELVKDCLTQATGGENAGSTENSGSTDSDAHAGNGSEVDVISGATISSTAVLNAVQIAYEFVSEQTK